MPSKVTVSLCSNARTEVTISRITVSGWARSMPTFLASGSHHAPMPRMTRPGARSSSVLNVAASRAGLRLQQSTTPEPTLIRSVTLANAAIGTVASRTRRLSACHTAWNPRCSAYLTISMPSRIGWASCRYSATGVSMRVTLVVDILSTIRGGRTDGQPVRLPSPAPLPRRPVWVRRRAAPARPCRAPRRVRARRACTPRATRCRRSGSSR